MKTQIVAIFLIGNLVAVAPCTAQSTSTDYLQKLSTKIKKHYFPHQHLKRNMDTMRFCLTADGKASNIEVLGLNQKQKISKGEKAVLEYAITSSSPFEKPPDEIKCPATIQVTLDNRNAGVKANVITTSPIQTSQRKGGE